MIAEIPESDATGEVARIYADIRARLQLPVVNLIWRHLAALGHLEWSWDAVRDRLPEISASAAELNARARIQAENCEPLPLLPWSGTVAGILGAYERGNSMNLATVRLLLGDAPERHGAEFKLPAPAQIPPVPRFADIAGDLRALIDRLAAAGPGAGTGIRPTLWVHLAHAPEFLRAAEQPVTRLLTTPTFRGAHAVLSALSITPAEPHLPDTLATALDRFNRRISEMLLTGICLERSRRALMESQP
jgi:hypothetical protein